jgi:hypothetical protein
MKQGNKVKLLPMAKEAAVQANLRLLNYPKSVVRQT